MVDFLKEWRAVIFITLVMLVIIAVLVAVMSTTTPYIEAKRAVCYKSAQRFNPPIEWRWNPWGSGDGCELFMNGTWFPVGMVQPALK